VVQRFGYEAYGRAEVLAANWQPAADGYEWEVRYAGYRWDSESGLYQVRFRYLHPRLGRWVSRDPLGYVDGMGLYEYVRSNPSVGLDPLGLLAARVDCYQDAWIWFADALYDQMDAFQGHQGAFLDANRQWADATAEAELIRLTIETALAAGSAYLSAGLASKWRAAPLARASNNLRRARKMQAAHSINRAGVQKGAIVGARNTLASSLSWTHATVFGFYQTFGGGVEALSSLSTGVADPLFSSLQTELLSSAKNALGLAKILSRHASHRTAGVPHILQLSHESSLDRLWRELGHRFQDCDSNCD
jgi:RHS repeat-associated protein